MLVSVCYLLFSKQPCPEELSCFEAKKTAYLCFSYLSLTDWGFRLFLFFFFGTIASVPLF
uniref:Uncharacterized protein n=1 Tax=Arundo donax TaxID=35708 RepID=A0A0A9AXW4_ARUDO